MGSADGIDSEAFEYLQFALQRAEMHGSAYTAHIVVQADSEELDGFAVEEEPAVGIHLHGAHSEAR